MNLADPLTLRYYWRRWDARQLRILLAAMAAGVALGTWLLSLLSEPALRRTVGGVALGFALVQALTLGRARPLFGARPHWSVGALAGLGAGVTSTVAHSGGLVLGPYLVALRLGNAEIVATGGAVVAVTNLVKLAGYWQIGFLTAPVLLAALAASPLLVGGAWLGYRANRWLPRRWFALALLAIAIAGSLRLLLAE